MGLPRQYKKNRKLIQTAASFDGYTRKIYNGLCAIAFERIADPIKHQVRLTDLLKLLELETRNTDQIKTCLERLNETTVIIDVLGPDGGQILAGTTFIASWKIEKGILEYDFSAVMRELINHPDIFAKIQFQIQNKLIKPATVVLYELCVDYKKYGTPEMNLIQFRQMFGVENKYPQFKFLNIYVIRPAVDELNSLSAKTGFTVEVEFIKKGRSVCGLRFLVEPVRDPLEIELRKKFDTHELADQVEQDKKIIASYEKDQAKVWFDSLLTKEKARIKKDFQSYCSNCLLPESLKDNSGKYSLHNPAIKSAFEGFILKVMRSKRAKNE